MTTSAPPQLITTTATTTAVVRGVVAMTELPAFYDRVFGTLPGVLAAQGVEVTGPAFGLYRGIPAETVDLEVGFPTDRPVADDGEVTAGELPAGRVARAVHSGSFDGLGPAWQDLAGWIAGQGLRPGDTFWEVYLTEPSPEMDPRDLRTELNWVVS
ncbi:AraC family transcriptional regulator [Pseudonocardia sp. EC080610-09]|uniref:GyrI-like domain-containing protein n=1 Tax=unclassified Pseudonocardia TaxID=2619320 RepID=UPI0006CB0C41|nr:MULTISPECIES: GyrI-like domain-containing protein [unclassified Pseudonocardia]ALE74829.1 AraC family transcriptional regulator [Pseudonocardia sp. EC080625-04]ALL74161.1 AraC family transcriptional regulator [Pseudonocardia sp. EC080610-09]ALL81186.1 AraC family transcriptional regulator [Pseudonocardia sp. EC080619-01]